jgi:beta-mannanase
MRVRQLLRGRLARALVTALLITMVIAASATASRTSKASGAHGTSTSRQQSHRQPQPPSARSQIYWGAWIGSQLTGNEAPWDTGAISAFESEVGKNVSLVNFSSPWANCSSNPCTYYNFDSTAMNNIRNVGAIPFFSWGSDSLPFSVNEPNFSLASIIAGNWDSYITTWATAAKNWGHPFFLRFDWEMNANWFPWGVGVDGNTAAQYVQAWRHVHDIFASVGATNVTWVWCPNADPSSEYTPVSSLYPGDSYVDWTALDGYNWGAPWMSFNQLFQSSYDNLLKVAPSKPIAIGETASTEKGSSKAAWITDTLGTELPTAYPQIKAFLWFEKYDSGMDWPVETSTSAVGAFAAGISSSIYATNQFGSLGDGPVQPLS